MKLRQLSRILSLNLCLAAVIWAAPRDRAEVLFDGGPAQLYLAGGQLQVKRGDDLLAEVRSIEFNFSAPKSVTVTSRDAGKVVLQAVYPSTAKYVDEKGDLTVDIAIERVPGGLHFTAKPEWAQNTTIRLRDLDDHFFGVLEMLYPNNRRSPDLRGVTVDVDSNGNDSQYLENYASVWSAFYMTARGYASFFDTFAKGRYVLGVNGETELWHRTGALDWYVFVGDSGDSLLASYYQVIGAPKAPPMWALGPIGWRDANKGAEEILEDVRHMTELRIPFTSWFVDRPYSDGNHAWSKMGFSEKFADPKKWIGRLEREYDMRFMTWVAPMTFGDTEFPGLLPGDRGYMDLTDPAALQEFEKRLKEFQYSAGVHGHKNDRAEEFFPEMAKWKDGTPFAETRNKYLYLYAKVTHDMLTRAWGADHCNFARGAFHRAQPYLSAVWGGDSRASWDGLASNLANAIRCGFLGFPVWGTDVGGYLGGRIDEELYARWLQWGVWNGLFEIKLDATAGEGADRPPWVYSNTLQHIFRDSCALRMELLPYLYSLSHTSGRTGVLMKPLAYVWPADGATHGVWDEYMFGPAFLVAPITEPGGRRSVYLPEGRWHDFHEPARTFGGKRTIEVTATLDRIPVFVRANSLYVTGELPLGNRRKWITDTATSFVIHATPGESGERAKFELVDHLEQDASKVIELSQAGDTAQVTVPALGGAGEVWVRCEPPVRVKLNGRVFDAKFDAASRSVRIPFAPGMQVYIEVSPREPAFLIGK